MDSEFSKKLALALGIEPVKPPGPIQQAYDRYKKHLGGLVIETPLPERVHLLPENFPYWIKLESPDPTNPTKWIAAKAKVVVPLLDAGKFDETGFRIDHSRARALFHIPDILRAPHCIHRNLRHADRGDGGIKGGHMYVAYYGKKQRKVAFTFADPVLGKVVLVSSFWSNKKWVEECAHMPAVYCCSRSKCTCK
jgi:hypothetical protein